MVGLPTIFYSKPMPRHKTIYLILAFLTIHSSADAVEFPVFSKKRVHSYSEENVVYLQQNTTNKIQSTNTQQTLFSSMPRVQSVANGSIFITSTPSIDIDKSYSLRGSIPPPDDPTPPIPEELPIGDNIPLVILASFYSLIRFNTRDIVRLSKPREAAKR